MVLYFLMELLAPPGMTRLLHRRVVGLLGSSRKKQGWGRMLVANVAPGVLSLVKVPSPEIPELLSTGIPGSMPFLYRVLD
jgi:hypothetical protein